MTNLTLNHPDKSSNCTRKWNLIKEKSVILIRVDMIYMYSNTVHDFPIYTKKADIVIDRSFISSNSGEHILYTTTEMHGK